MNSQNRSYQVCVCGYHEGSWTLVTQQPKVKNCQEVLGNHL